MDHDFTRVIWESVDGALNVGHEFKCKCCDLKVNLPAEWSQDDQTIYLEETDFGRTCNEPGGGSGQ